MSRMLKKCWTVISNPFISSFCPLAPFLNRRIMKRVFLSLLSLCLIISGCNTKKVDITTDDLLVDIQDLYFQGAQPDIDYSTLVSILGEPQEYLDIPGDYDEREHSPIYYLRDGKIICHWLGEEDELIGMIEYVPFNTNPILLETIVSGNLSDYGITNATKAIRIYRDNVLYYRLLVENTRIKSIEYWMAKRQFMNIAY